MLAKENLQTCSSLWYVIACLSLAFTDYGKRPAAEHCVLMLYLHPPA